VYPNLFRVNLWRDRAATSDWDVSYGETRRIEANTVLEPISPELVLVDPELRREVRARLLGDLLLETLPKPGPAPSQAEPAPSTVEAIEPGPPRPPAPMPLSEALHRPPQVAPKRRKRRLAPALLPVSLAVNVILIALSVSDARIARTSPSAPLAIDPPAPNQLAPAVPATKPPSTKKAHRPAATTSRGKAPKAKSGAPRRSAAAREARGKVEQKVLNTVIQSPTGKLPRALIDPITGLAKNGLQAVCRRSSSGYSCVVRPAQHGAGEGLRVRYTVMRGRGVFSWGRYRSG
jgi:hypothetical protein